MFNCMECIFGVMFIFWKYYFKILVGFIFMGVRIIIDEDIFKN